MNKPSNWLLIFLSLIAALFFMQPAKADCGWFINNSCSDVGNSLARCGLASDEKFCSGPKPRNSLTAKCCCCDKTLLGCCLKTAKANNQQTAMDSTVAKCFANGYWANVKWYEGQTAYNNTCITVKNNKECKWVKRTKNVNIGTGDTTCRDIGYQVATVKECEGFGLGSGSKTEQESCCCRQITVNSNNNQQQPGAGTDQSRLIGAGNDSNSTQSLPTPSQLTNPLGTTSIPQIIGRIIKAFLLIVGSIALLMFIYGGFTWMTAAGNESRVEKGRSILMWAAIGLVIIFVAYVLVRFVMEAIGVG